MTTETQTIQTWPSGRGYEYRGSAHEPTAERRLRIHNYNGGTPNRWRRGTVAEWREILHSRRAEMYSERDILCCDSMLVGDLLREAQNAHLEAFNHAFEYEEIRNLYPDPEDMEADDCESWLTERGLDCARDESDDDGDYLNALRDVVRDNAEPAEVYEWWRVSSWLCDQLDAIGRVTVYVVLAENAVIYAMARRAALNQSGESHALIGRISAYVIARSKEIKP